MVDDRAVAPIESVKTGIFRVVTDIEGTNYRRKEIAGPVVLAPPRFLGDSPQEILANPQSEHGAHCGKLLFSMNVS